MLPLGLVSVVGAATLPTAATTEGSNADPVAVDRFGRAVRAGDTVGKGVLTAENGVAIWLLPETGYGLLRGSAETVELTLALTDDCEVVVQSIESVPVRRGGDPPSSGLMRSGPEGPGTRRFETFGPDDL
jgi:hypothetical protein